MYVILGRVLWMMAPFDAPSVQKENLAPQEVSALTAPLDSTKIWKGASRVQSAPLDGQHTLLVMANAIHPLQVCVS